MPFWPLAGEARTRVTPSVLPQFYRGSQTAEQWARNWCRSKEVNLSSPLGKHMLRTGIALDHFVLYDSKTQSFNPVNSPGVECLVRDLFGIEKAFQSVSKASTDDMSFTRDKTRDKSRTSAKWHRRDEYDVGALMQSQLVHTVADTEVQKRQARKALYEKYTASLPDHP